MAARQRGTPLWITLGCGCVLLVALAIGAAVVAGYLGVSAFKGYIEDMKDPAARGVKAGEILGASRLPEGYTAQLFLRVPWLVDMVVLSDGEPMVVQGEGFDLESEAVGEHLFVYFKLRKKRMDEEEVERMLRGDSTSDGVKVDIDIQVESDEELARGSFALEPQRLAWVAHRGELDIDHDALEGIYSQVIIDCPGDDLTRVAIWFQRDDEDREGTADLAGSPADEAALRGLMGHFNVCVD